jgi:pyruvate/2-oxoglutarate dehydrogenase complex dihydrolipoamide acyltransferase (E2) component
VWLKDVGDSVDVGEPIAEVMTEEVNVEVEFPVAGVLDAVRREPEDTVNFGQVIAVVREPGA